MNAKQPNGPRSLNAVELGAMMCEARENLGHDLEDVARELKIRPEHLYAIETGQLSDLPGNAYVSGFTRAYAEYLGLEGDEIVRQFRAVGVVNRDRTNLHLPSPVEQGRLPTALILVLGALIAVGAYGGWYLFSVQDRDASREVSGLPTEMSMLIEKKKTKAEKKSGNPQTAATIPEMKTKKLSSPASGLTLQPGNHVPATEKIMTPSPASVSSQTALIPSALTKKKLAVPPANRASQETLPSSNIVRIVVLATADTFVAVRTVNNEPFFSKLMRRGDRYAVPLGADLVLDTGNAGGLQLSINGSFSAPLGLSGEVRRNIPLDPEKLLRYQDW